MQFSNLDSDVISMILSIHNCVLISSQLINKNIREMMKNLLVQKIPVTDNEVNDYVNTPSRKYKINFGSFHDTQNCRYIMDIYMVENDKIVLNPIYHKNQVGAVGAFGLRKEKYDFKKTRQIYEPKIKCELDFISQCKILQQRFLNHQCLFINEKILQLLYDIVLDFKTNNDVRYSYLIHDLTMYDIKDYSLQTIEFVKQDTDVITSYLYEKILPLLEL